MNSEFYRKYRCSVCLKIPTKSVLVPECMHRGCKDCFEEILRRCNHECPECRGHIGTKRAFRQDPNFDALLEQMNQQMQVHVHLLPTFKGDRGKSFHLMFYVDAVQNVTVQHLIGFLEKQIRQTVNIRLYLNGKDGNRQLFTTETIEAMRALSTDSRTINISFSCKKKM